MYNFILQILIMLSLGTMIYLIARAAPRIGDVEESFRQETFHTKIDRWLAKIPFEKIDMFLSASIEKILRKSKLFLMKCDNLLTNHLHKIKKKNSVNLRKEEKPSLFSSESSSENKE